MERIVAKIENDFNPDNTDWIARVPAWCFDAMQQLKILSVIKRKRKLDVINRIAYSDCNIIKNELKVYNSNGCEIEEAGSKVCGCRKSSTGELQSQNLTNTTDYVVNGGNVDYGESHSEHINTDDYNKRHRVSSSFLRPVKDKDYVIIDDNHIELNFDTDYIIIENLEVATAYSEYYQAEIPIIPDDGYLLEALAYYCLYKMLCRGMKHPVFNLAASQYGTNPYYIWNQLKSKAKASVINSRQEDGSKAWQSYFYNYTFKPKG